MILRHLLLPDILDLVESGRLNDVREFLAMQPAPEIAELLTALEDKDRVLLFRLLPRHLADEVFSLLDLPYQDLLLKNMAQEEVRQVISGLSPDDRTPLFEELPARVTKSLLGLLNDQDRKQTLTLLSYPEGSVGRLMTDRYVEVEPEWTVAQSMEHLRKAGIDSETLAMVYITDEKGRLADDLRLRKLIIADPSTRVADLLDGHYACLHSLQPREEAVQVFRKYDLYALPVVDSDGILLGIVTVDDILDVAEAEATEDFHKLATVRPLQVSLKDATLGLLFRKRIGWLLGLVLVNIFTGMGIKMFEDTIVAVAALVALMPLLIGSGGNAGAQAATLVVRAIATGEIGSSDWKKLFLREIGVSTCIGLAMAGAAFFLGWMLGDLRVAIVVAISMVTVVIAGSLMGTVLPMVLNRLKLDPATASVPLITSMADILGVLIYFSIANVVLSFLKAPPG
ncbi:MAG TPA: magnesium transporter [Verrucomicrobia bacterium]|nr:magnesium transporter [Verrucomicrobiota bacterium]